MTRYELSHLPDHELLRGLNTLVKQDRATTAELLAHLSEVDERGLYLPAGYPSMAAWCVGALGLSEDAAFRRIRAARTARAFPEVFPAIAEGRLTLAAVLQLTPYLRPENAADLLGEAAGLARPALEVLLARRFPRPDLEPAVLELTGTAGAEGASQVVANAACQLAPAPVGMTRAEQMEPRARVAPLAPQRYGAQFTLDEEAYENLCYAQALLGHTADGNDVAKVFARALESLVRDLERRKFAKRSRMASPKRGRRATSAESRHVPAHVRREVWQRDGGQCSFVGENGHRCEATQRLEFDHATPFARDGEASVTNIRLRCRAHNQYGAEQAYGREFMEGKRAAARGRAGKSRARDTSGAAPSPAVASAQAPEAAPVAAAMLAQATPAATSDEAGAVRAPVAVPVPGPRTERESLVPWLRALRCPAAEARRLAAIADALLPDGTLEERIKLALKHGRQVGVKVKPATAA